MSYNETTLAAADTVIKLVDYANVSANYLPFQLLLLGVFFILLLTVKRKGYDFQDAIIGASFISFVLSVFLVYTQLLSPFPLMYLFLLLTAGSVFKKLMWP
jgi:hypothetical protein